MLHNEYMDKASDANRQSASVRNYDFYIGHLETGVRGKDLTKLLTMQLRDLADDEKHIWDSSEYTQLTAMATWIAAARATVVNDLLTFSYRGDKLLENDVSAVVDDLARSAEAWLTYRDGVSLNTDYRLPEDAVIDFTYKWPSPDKYHISDELFDGLRNSLGLHSSLDVSILMDSILPQSAPSGEYMHPFFKRFKKKIDAEIEQLIGRRANLQKRMSPTLDPNREPGRTIYLEMTKLIEDITAYGAYRLYPALSDPNMRINEDYGKAPEQTETVLPSFDPEMLRVPKRPTLPVFSGDLLVEPVSTLSVPRASTSLPQFTIDLLATTASDDGQYSHDDSEQRKKPSLPKFDEDYFKTNNVSPPQSASAKKKTLPEFDPESYFRSKEETPHPLEVFDPDNYFNE